MGHGAIFLGHAHPATVQAVQEQIARGSHYGESHQLEIEWSELIQSMMPVMERIEFCACGQEANMMAIRLSRIHTGRKKVLRFEENFHGWADELVDLDTPGIIGDQVRIIPGNDLASVEKELATRQYAILLIEGGGAHMGQIPWDANYIHALRELTVKYNTVFCIDEVVTGFRESPGSWQSQVGVQPDLTTLGKITGGGLSVGVVGGRSDIMDAFNPASDRQHFIGHSGTWNANPLTAAAGIAALKQFNGGELQRKVCEIGDLLREKGNESLQQLAIDCRLYGRSIVHIYLGPIDNEPSGTIPLPTPDAEKLLAGNPEKAHLCLHLLHRGIATARGRRFILSSAHTEQDIDKTIAALCDSLQAMVAEGRL
jgi:glutamate-1-semialdehyde 2,1-aminomutase